MQRGLTRLGVVAALFVLLLVVAIPAGAKDKNPPQTRITSGPKNHSTTTDNTPTFAFTSSDPQAGFECSVDASAFAACVSPITIGPLAVGQHTFRVRAVDQAGNRDPKPAKVGFTVGAAITCVGQPATITGTDKGETIQGTDGADVIVGLGGKDTIYGQAGNDLICAGQGGDRVISGTGNDGVLGEGGPDTIGAGAGADRALGGASNDHLLGGVGNDVLNGGLGDDVLNGFGGRDTLTGFVGRDTCIGGPGADHARGCEQRAGIR
jgi:Ca2+-binding RTX toxin-like protein